MSPSEVDAPAPAEASDARNTVLLVEDSHVQRIAIAAQLSKNGFNVAQATDGVDALNRLKKMRPLPVVVISDIGMPHMNGISLCKQIKAEYNNLPVVMLTELNSGRNEAAAIEAGADEFLAKPVEEHQLMLRLRNMLKLSQLRSPELSGWYRVIFEAIPEAVVVANSDHRVVEANAAATRMLGYERQELIDLNLETSSWSGKTLLRRKNGSVLAVDTATARASMAGQLFYVTTMRHTR
ncbi:MAG TPA: response regulator [Chloroflexota bacterium]|nr:response regulator [Chloroflexota bacterium]